MACTEIRLFSPAKLNLFLHVTGRRANGYHELQTLFRLIARSDVMQFAQQKSGVLSLHCAGPRAHGLPMDNNLVLQAARALRDFAGDLTLSAKINLHKILPQGAGLGGGSSNAATTLVALNELWQLNLGQQQLCEIGVSLGADVPVFVAGRTAWGEGIGEKLTPVKLPACWYLVVTPACEVATEAIFSHQQLTRNSPTIKMSDFLAGRSRNDCEKVTKLLYPEVGKALDYLEKFAKPRMTGTGSSIFAEFQTEADALAVQAKLPKSLQSFVAQGVNNLAEIDG
ncbi:MAG: 4-diphosphocytidyl-2-C-methyl-D-erythritol kinase [Pseudohongiellaceae bacterium]|jgi:4-diphosphocytidyl-2-C-methyl-D-erythritol kinase